MATRTARRTTRRKKTTKKTTPRRTAKRTTSARSTTFRFDKPDKPRTKAAFFKAVAESTGLTRAQVAQVFEASKALVANDLKALQKSSKDKKAAVNFGGLMKVVVQHKPATRARKGVNPFTGEETMFKAKPARNVLKVRPLKALKDLV